METLGHISFGGLIGSRDVGLHLEILLWIFRLPFQNSNASTVSSCAPLCSLTLTCMVHTEPARQVACPPQDVLHRLTVSPGPHLNDAGSTEQRRSCLLGHRHCSYLLNCTPSRFSARIPHNMRVVTHQQKVM